MGIANRRGLRARQWACPSAQRTLDHAHVRCAPLRCPRASLSPATRSGRSSDCRRARWRGEHGERRSATVGISCRTCGPVFTRMIDSELVLGPFMGASGLYCVPLGEVCAGGGQGCRIAIGQGRLRLFRPYRLRFGDELGAGGSVVRDGAVIAVIDLNSPQKARFDEQLQVEELADVIARADLIRIV